MLVVSSICTIHIILPAQITPSYPILNDTYDFSDSAIKISIKKHLPSVITTCTFLLVFPRSGAWGRVWQTRGRSQPQGHTFGGEVGRPALSGRSQTPDDNLCRQQCLSTIPFLHHRSVTCIIPLPSPGDRVLQLWWLALHLRRGLWPEVQSAAVSAEQRSPGRSGALWPPAGRHQIRRLLRQQRARWEDVLVTSASCAELLNTEDVRALIQGDLWISEIVFYFSKLPPAFFRPICTL